MSSLDFSILISTYNRAADMPRLVAVMDALDTQGLTGELLIVDNNSSDDTSEVLGTLDCHFPLVALHEPRQGKNNALNQAVGRARGDLLIFTDDDVRPSPAWVRGLVEAARRHPDDGIFCGQVVPTFPPGSPAWLDELGPRLRRVMYGEFVAEEPDVETPTDRTPFGANIAIRRSLFDTYSYDTSIGPRGKKYAMGSETELLKRLQADGVGTIYVPGIPVAHLIRPNQMRISWMMLRAQNFGRGRARLTGGRPVRLRDRLALPVLRAFTESANQVSDHLDPEQIERMWKLNYLVGWLEELFTLASSD